MSAVAIMSALAAPFHPDRVSWRVGSTMADKSRGMALAYIDARDVMQRLDAVLGLDWQCEYMEAGGGVVCRIGIFVGGQWRWRSNGGTVIADGNTSDAKEMAEKGSYSDAFKRAAVLWGVGQYLYDVDSPWVELEPKGKSHVISPRAMPKLREALAKASKGLGSNPPPMQSPPARDPEPAPSGPSPEALARSQEPLKSAAAEPAPAAEPTKTAAEREPTPPAAAPPASAQSSQAGEKRNDPAPEHQHNPEQWAIYRKLKDDLDAVISASELRDWETHSKYNIKHKLSTSLRAMILLDHGVKKSRLEVAAKTKRAA